MSLAWLNIRKMKPFIYCPVCQEGSCVLKQVQWLNNRSVEKSFWNNVSIFNCDTSCLAVRVEKNKKILTLFDSIPNQRRVILWQESKPFDFLRFLIIFESFVARSCMICFKYPI